MAERGKRIRVVRTALPQLPGYYDAYQPQYNRSDVFRASWDRTLSPTLLNYFFSGVNDWKQYASPYQETRVTGKASSATPTCQTAI